jgi:rubrerythrin
MTDEANFMRGKWRCSECGRLNSMDHDEVCPRCIDTALEADSEKLEALTSGERQNT